MEDDTHHWTGPEERTMQVFMFNNLIIFAVLSIDNVVNGLCLTAVFLGWAVDVVLWLVHPDIHLLVLIKRDVVLYG